MSRPAHRSDHQPWYRIPIVWLVIAVPLSAVVVGVIMLTLAIRSNDGLVVDDYYRRGKEINRELARDRFAEEHRISARVRFTDDVQVVVTGNDGVELSQQPVLNLIHPTRAGKDAEVLLYRTQTNTYRGKLPLLGEGRRIIQLSTGNWRLLGTARMPEDQEILLRPVH